MPRRTADPNHPITSSARCASYQCGHISRSEDQAIKRALVLHLAKQAGVSFSTRGEGTDVLAAYRLMQAGRTCAEVRNYAGTAPADPVTREGATSASGSITPQVCEVMALIAKGHSHPQVAEATGRQTETVRSLVARARMLTGAHTQEDAVVALVLSGHITL